jgi:hypothetical protein
MEKTLNLLDLTSLVIVTNMACMEVLIKKVVTKRKKAQAGILNMDRIGGMMPKNIGKTPEWERKMPLIEEERKEMMGMTIGQGKLQGAQLATAVEGHDHQVGEVVLGMRVLHMVEGVFPVTSLLIMRKGNAVTLKC